MQTIFEDVVVETKLCMKYHAYLVELMLHSVVYENNALDSSPL